MDLKTLAVVVEVVLIMVVVIVMAALPVVPVLFSSHILHKYLKTPKWHT
jgi:hypothetical protein